MATAAQLTPGNSMLTPPLSVDPVARRIKVVTKPEKPSAAVVHGTVPSTVYDLEYDVLVMGVGARANTFGIQGVEEHVQFLKELSDARGIRKGITECAAHTHTHSRSYSHTINAAAIPSSLYQFTCSCCVRCLEAAAHDTVSEEERKRLLHWVVVGGGPTGVEFSGELSDFIHQVQEGRRGRTTLHLSVPANTPRAAL